MKCSVCGCHLELWGDTFILEVVVEDSSSEDLKAWCLECAKDIHEKRFEEIRPVSCLHCEEEIEKWEDAFPIWSDEENSFLGHVHNKCQKVLFHENLKRLVTKKEIPSE